MRMSAYELCSTYPLLTVSGTTDCNESLHTASNKVLEYSLLNGFEKLSLVFDPDYLEHVFYLSFAVFIIIQQWLGYFYDYLF